VAETVLVTGVLGCLGAWAARVILDDGDTLVGFDPGANRSRLELVLGEEAASVTVVPGDVADLAQLERALDEHDVTRVVHLAGLQVPFCRDDPPLGASVNVVGTANVFQAVARRLDRIPGVAYASSAAVYGPHDPSPAPEAGGCRPGTHYGVTKLANEGTARIFWQDASVPSIGIRPYVVYGPGRDQGLTSGPTAAMAAAARGEAWHVGYGGTAQYDFAPDVARAFVAAAHRVGGGDLVANYPGVVASMAEVVAAIEEAAPAVAGSITWDETPLPFPAELQADALERAIGRWPRTPLAAGVAATVTAFRAATA
jgi:nucleoside-diphosphate-sugar epimerase